MSSNFPIPRLLTKLIQKADGVYRSSTGAIAKENWEGAPYSVANEYICTELGRFLQLPLPPCALIRPDGFDEPLFATLDFGFMGQDELPPIADESECYRNFEWECSGLILFDILIANCDRHKYNLTANYFAKNIHGKDAPLLGIFDQNVALFGRDKGLGASRLESMKTKLGIDRHCIKSVIDSNKHFGIWSNRIGSIPDFVITELCKRTVGIGVTSEESIAASEFLNKRKREILHLIGNNMNEFPAIKLWI